MAYEIRKKTGAAPFNLEFKVPVDTGVKGKETFETLEFACHPTLSGDKMLELSSVQETSYAGGIRAMFDAALLDDETKKRWADFLATNPNAPDLDELNEVNNDLVTRYSNRLAENPTQQETTTSG